MNEIVRKLRENKSKVVFESSATDPDELEPTVSDSNDAIEESIKLNPGVKFKNAGFDWEVLAIKGDYTLIYAKDKKMNPYVVAWKIDTGDGSWAQGHYFSDEKTARKFLNTKSGNLLESDAPTVCICGSTNIVEENGEFTCDDCGRILDDNVRESIESEKKPLALKKSLEYWRAGQYQKAVTLYKKYGITDAEFAKAMVKGIRESEEEGIDLDAEDIDESLDMSVATPYVEKDGEESLRVLINGIEYRYRSNTLSISELLKKFMGIHKHSVGAALGWLKKNSYIYFNGRTKQFAESAIVESDRTYVLNFDDNKGDNTPTIRMSTPANDAGMDLKSVEEYGNLEDMSTEQEKEDFKKPNLYNYSYASKSTSTRPYMESAILSGLNLKLKEDTEELTVISPEEDTNLDKNIIRAIQTPVSTADKPNLDAAITEATKKRLKESTPDVDTSKWKFSSGKSTPTGRGMWFFQIGKDEVNFYGMYSDAKKQAIDYAKKRGVQKIILLP